MWQFIVSKQTPTISINYVIKEPISFFYDHDESNSSMKPELTDINFSKDIVESTIKNLKTILPQALMA